MQRYDMWSITTPVLESILEASRHTHPNEFVALLGGNKNEKRIEELIVLPAISGPVHALLRIDLLPYTAKAIGSIHSHPTPNPLPSRQDKHLFQRQGEIHLIVAYPYTIQSIRAYDTNGKAVLLQSMPAPKNQNLK